MNIKEYIESGILEAYVLGALDESERAAVADNIARYPELAAELAAIEGAMYQFAEAGAVTPPAHLQEDIWAAIEASKPADTATPKTIPFPATRPAGAPAWQRAAIWIALGGSLLANVLLLGDRNKNKQEMTAMQQQVQQANEQQQLLAAKLDEYSRQYAMLMDASMQPVIMRSVQPEKPMAGMVMYNKSKGEAYVSAMNMPMPPQGKQYQFWVIKDGKPVDMGVLPTAMIASGGMQRVAMPMADGQAFAISLEKEGGNPTPTEVMVVGEIRS